MVILFGCENLIRDCGGVESMTVNANINIYATCLDKLRNIHI